MVGRPGGVSHAPPPQRKKKKTREKKEWEKSNDRTARNNKHRERDDYSNPLAYCS